LARLGTSLIGVPEKQGLKPAPNQPLSQYQQSKCGSEKQGLKHPIVGRLEK
jgi:hypothetical protein